MNAPTAIIPLGITGPIEHDVHIKFFYFIFIAVEVKSASPSNLNWCFSCIIVYECVTIPVRIYPEMCKFCDIARNDKVKDIFIVFRWGGSPTFCCDFTTNVQQLERGTNELARFLRLESCFGVCGLGCVTVFAHRGNVQMKSHVSFCVSSPFHSHFVHF